MPTASPFDELVQDLCELQTRRECKQVARAARPERPLVKAIGYSHMVQDLDRLAKAHAQSAAVRKQQLILQKFANLARAAKAGKLSGFEAAKLDVLRHHAAERGLFDHRRTLQRGAA